MKTLQAKVGAALAALLCAASAQAGIVLSFTPSSQHVSVGDMVTVDVTLSGLGTEILSAFDINVLWNGAVMGLSRSYAGSTTFNQLGGAYGANPIFVFDTVDPGNWGVQASAVADDATVAANQADSFLFAQLQFSADADGVTTLTLGPDADFERNFVGLNFATLDVTVGSACVAVGTGSCDVPEPASYGLAALALLGAVAPGLWRRRGKRAA